MDAHLLCVRVRSSSQSTDVTADSNGDCANNDAALMWHLPALAEEEAGHRLLLAPPALAVPADDDRRREEAAAEAAVEGPLRLLPRLQPLLPANKRSMMLFIATYLLLWMRCRFRSFRGRMGALEWVNTYILLWRRAEQKQNSKFPPPAISGNAGARRRRARKRENKPPVHVDLLATTY